MKTKAFYLIIITTILISCTDKKEEKNLEIRRKIEYKQRDINDNFRMFEVSLKKINFHKIIDNKRLSQDKNLSDSKKILFSADSTFKIHKNKSELLSKEILGLIDSFIPTQKTKLEDIEMVREMFKKSFTSHIGAYNSNLQTIETSKDIINLLDKECKYQIKDDKIYFENSRCIEKYNAHITKIELIVMSEQHKEMNRKYEMIKKKY